MNEVTIRVPATTANLGPGYDCLGVALQIYNRVTVRRTPSIPYLDHPAMIREIATTFFNESQIGWFDFGLEINGDVPRSRGLGSSVTVRLGLLMGLNELCGGPLNRLKLAALCAGLEGHPDNAVPATFGGFTVAPDLSTQSLDRTVPGRFEVLPALHFVLLIPDFEVSTPEARKVLPSVIEHHDAVVSCANACRVTAAFATQNYQLLRHAFRDGLHQPFRKRLIPFLSDVIFNGETAGAIGGFLSGSGSTICCVALEKTEEIGEAMLAASGNAGARIVVTQADNAGAIVSP